MWNILDFITNNLYICTIALRFIAFIQVLGLGGGVQEGEESG